MTHRPQPADEVEMRFFREDPFGCIFAEAARPHGSGLQRIGISNLRGGIARVLAQLVIKVQQVMVQKVRQDGSAYQAGVQLDVF
jgi:hypothetical protein